MSNIDLDESGVIEMLEALSTKKIMGLEKKVLRKAANIVRKDARKRLRTDLPNASKKGKYSDTLMQGIMTSVREVKDGVDAKVHTYGSTKKTSGTFRTRFFETGTNERITKKGKKKRGRIKALYFFRDAVTSTKGQVQSTIDTELSKVIQNIADKHYG